MYKNLLAETVEKLTAHGHSPADVQFVKNGTTWCTWEEFAAIANFKYYANYGTIKIALHLEVVGKDWWLERDEYDGKEWWEYKTTPQKPTCHQAFTKKDVLSLH